MREITWRFCNSNVVAHNVANISRSERGCFVFGCSIYDFQSIPSEDKNQLARCLIY